MYFSFVSCSDIVATFMYCKPASGDVYFINKLLFFIECTVHEKRITCNDAGGVQYLCDVKSYISTCCPSNIFVLISERNTFFIRLYKSDMSTSTAEHDSYDSYLVENWDTDALIIHLEEQNPKRVLEVIVGLLKDRDR